MTKNVGQWDRVARGVGALGMAVSAALVPMPLTVQLLLGANAVYLTGTALAGTCLGYRLMGRSTCPTR